MKCKDIVKIMCLGPEVISFQIAGVVVLFYVNDYGGKAANLRSWSEKMLDSYTISQNNNIQNMMI